MVEVKEHAKDRIKESMGLSKKICDRVAEKTYTYGLKHEDVSGSLKRFLDKLFLSHLVANNMRIYNNKVFLFHDNTLVTVLNLPAKYHKTAKKINKQKVG